MKLWCELLEQGRFLRVLTTYKRELLRQILQPFQMVGGFELLLKLLRNEYFFSEKCAKIPLMRGIACRFMKKFLQH